MLKNDLMQNKLLGFNNPIVCINDSQICNFIGINKGCCCSFSHENNQNFYIILDNPQKKISDSLIIQNENVYYCKYCQFGTCVKQKKEHLKIIHHKLSNDEKDMFLKVWHWRLAISGDYTRVYNKAFKDLAENKFIEDSKTRSKFSYIKAANYGLLSIVIDIIIKGKLLILNPPLVYILKDENTNDIYQASWCKYCMGTKNIQCPSFKNLNEPFEPSIKYHELGIQMCLPVTMTKNGLKIHSPPHITLSTSELKKFATQNLAKEYADDYISDSSELDECEIPFAKSFPVEIISIHMNITKPSIQKIYNDKIKGSSQ